MYKWCCADGAKFRIIKNKIDMANYLLADYESVVNMNSQFKYRRRTPDGRVVLTLRDGMNLRNVNVQVVTEAKLREILETPVEAPVGGADGADMEHVEVVDTTENVQTTDGEGFVDGDGPESDGDDGTSEEGNAIDNNVEGDEEDVDTETGNDENESNIET